MSYVKFTDPLGQSVWVNSLLVQRVRHALPQERMDESIKTAIIMSGGNQMVQELPGDVVKLLEEASDVNGAGFVKRR